MPSCALQRVRRNVVRCFVATATSSSDRTGFRRTVGADGETSGRRRRRTGSAAAVLRAAPDGPSTDSEHTECVRSPLKDTKNENIFLKRLPVRTYGLKYVLRVLSTYFKLEVHSYKFKYAIKVLSAYVEKYILIFGVHYWAP